MKINFLLIGFFLTLSLFGCGQKKSSSSNPKQVEVEVPVVQWNLSSIEVGTLDFGVIDFNKSKVLKVEIINDGTETISGSPISSSQDFPIAFSTCKDLIAQSKCYIKINFSALGKTTNSFTGNLNWGSFINVVSAQISRQNEVTDSLFTSNGLPVVAYDFGTIDYNHNFLKSFFIKNSGNVPLSSQVQITGSDFSLVYDSCSAKTIAVSNGCLFKVFISGQGKSGPVSGAVSYNNKMLNLTASVKTQPEVSAEFSDFVFVYNNQFSETQPIDLLTLNLNVLKEFKFYVKNIGTKAGKLDSVSFLDNFNVFYNGCEGRFLEPNQTCELRTHLNPTIKGSFSSNVSADVQYQINTKPVQWTVRSPGDKISCGQQIPNALSAEITWTGSVYTNCELISCNPSHHKSLNICDANQVDCSNATGTGIKTWNGSEYGSCLFSACNSGYYINNNSCLAQSCSPNSQTSCIISNGIAHQVCNSEGSSYGSCLLDSCVGEFHQNGNVCEANVIACTDALGSGNQTWSVSSYGSCQYSSCNSGYYLSVNSCLPQICSPNSTASCFINNGSGLKTCNSEGSLYGSCVLSGCDSGFHSNLNSCDPNSISCPMTNGTAIQTWNGTSYGSCLVTSCTNGTIPSTDNSACVYKNATGGDISFDGNYKIHTFRSGAIFSLTSGTTTGFEYLVVGGGAAGGGSHGGGGGAGGLKTGTTSISIGNQTITVGNGGLKIPGVNGVGASGQPSSLGALVSVSGGGGGGYEATPANSGASGGGGPGKTTGAGSGTSGQGFAGGIGANNVNYGAGGGGGSSSVGSAAPTNGYGGNGGAGTTSTISGSSVCYAGGGGGAAYTPAGNTSPLGGVATCGGGTGGRYGTTYTPGNPGTANTGGGGGGCGSIADNYAGASGGSGVVIIRYLYK